MPTVWSQFGASANEAAELCEYGALAFDPSAFQRSFTCPLPDEPFVAAWERYVAESARRGAAACLRARLVQLRFPIAAGISVQPAYSAAVRRGVGTEGLPAECLVFADPDGLRLFMHSTAAGRVPVILASAREDSCAP
jgi:hypothetical protein